MLDLNIICEMVCGICGKIKLRPYVNQPYYGPMRLKIRNARQILAEVSNIEFEESLSSGSDTDTRFRQTRRRTWPPHSVSVLLSHAGSTYEEVLPCWKEIYVDILTDLHIFQHPWIRLTSGRGEKPTSIPRLELRQLEFKAYHFNDRPATVPAAEISSLNNSRTK
jgi:hypothetical protein